MEFKEIVRKRRMHRAFKKDPISEESLKRILETAIRAPSAGFTQGWSFVVVRNEETKRKLAVAAGEDFYIGGGHSPFISGAPLVIVPCGSEARYIERYREPDKVGPVGEIEFDLPWWLIDAAFASLLIMLASTDEGLGTCFVGAFDREPVREALGIPKEYEPLALMPLGYPEVDKKSPSLKRGRKPVSEVVHFEHW